MDHFIIFFVAFLSSALLFPAACIYDSNLERIHFQYKAREVRYPSLATISTLNYHNVTEVYVKALECHQFVGALKNEMAERLNETVPPPHHHCFITERNFDHIHSYNHNSTQGLRCDQYILAQFPSAIQRAIFYEGQHLRNQETAVMQRVLNMVRNLQQALSNLTGLVVDERTVIGRRDAVPCYRYASPSSVEEEEEEEGEGEEEEETSQGEQEEGTLTGSRTGLVSRESSDTEETTGGHYLQSVENGDDEEDTTPTATQPRRCSDIQSASDQFIYVTELWYALYYLSLDLLQQRDCLRY